MTSDLPPTDQPDPFALPQALRELAEVVAEPATVADVLQTVSHHCKQLLPVDGVGVLLMDIDGGLVVAASTDEVGIRVEELESELTEGPCFRAMTTGSIVACPDLSAHHDDYPRFTPKALEAGVSSIHAMPMTFRTDQIGAFDLIAREPRQLSSEQLAVGQLLTDVTTSYIMNGRMLQQQTELSEHLRKALDTRIAVEQAKGVLAERHASSTEQVFARLRRYARDNRRRLGEVAADVVRGDLDLPPET